MKKIRDKVRGYLRPGDGSTSSPPSRTPSAASSNTTEQHVPPTSLPADQATTGRHSQELSISQRLWNAAYDSLEKDKDKDTAKLAKSYAETLTKILRIEAALSVASSEDDISIKLKDPIRRQEYMKRLVEEGQKRVATLSKTLSGIGDVAQFILSAKGMIDAAIQNIPQAALPWAGVCIGLQILLNPGKASKDNLTGIAHVTSRMSWYCALTEHLLNKKNIAIGNESFAVVMQALEKEIIALYRALILYQMVSAHSYYRNQGTVFLRGLANLDDWDGLLESIKKAETTVEQMSAQYCREYQKSSLRQIVNSGRKIEAQLGDIHLNLRKFINQQIEARMDDEYTECLRGLFVANPLHDMERIEHNKDKLLDDAFSWILTTTQFAAFTNWIDDDPAFSPCRLLWIKGAAGTGKTMLLIGIIRELTKQSAMLAPNVSHFFCQGTDSARNSATAVLRSLIWMLLVQQPHLVSHIHAKYKYSGPSLFTDSNAWFALSDVFESMLKDARFSRAYLVVDALDECSKDLNLLIQLISTSIMACEKVKWLVASRPEVELGNPNTAGALVELDAQSLEDPVHAYINHKLSALGNRKGYSEDVMASISSEIHQRAANIFLWVALVFKQLDGVHGWDAIEMIEGIPAGLSELYDHMMFRIEKFGGGRHHKTILAASSLAYRPLSLSELSVLASVPAKVHLQTIIEECGSFLTIDKDTVYLIHQSAKDYLNKNYNLKLQPGGIVQGHTDMYKRSIAAISKLHKNIYNLSDFGYRPKDAQPPDPDPLASMRYSCLFWADHFCDASKLENEGIDDGQVCFFVKDHLLRWLESLSLLGKFPDGARSIRTILQKLQSSTSPQLTRFLKDAEKFILCNGSIIDRAPLQVYGSALVFSPNSNEVKQRQWNEKLSFIKDVNGIKDHNEHLQTLEAHEDNVRAIVFSPDGKTLASASIDETVRLWDATTGVLRQTLQHDCEWSSSLALTFSPDSKMLALATDEGVIRLWDAVTGAPQQMLEGSWVDVIAFSRDCNMLALASADQTIHLWNTTTQAFLQTLKGHDGRIRAITFLLDDKTLASASDDQTIRSWDTTTGMLQQMSRVNWSKAIMFSPDGKTLASTSNSQTIQLWDTVTGVLQQTVESREKVRAIAFLPNSKTLAESTDSKIRLWDVTTGALLQTLEGYDSWAYSMAFSPNGNILASADNNGRIWLWDAMARAPLQQTAKSHGDRVIALAFSPGGKTLASASYGGAIGLWDAATATLQQVIESPGSRVGAIAFSLDGKTLALASGGSIQLWDVATGTLQQTVESHGKPIMAMAFTPNGETLALAFFNEIIRLFNMLTGEFQQPFESMSGRTSSIAFSPDGKTLAAASYDDVIELWDTATGELRQTLLGKSVWISALEFSPDGQFLHTNGGCISISSDCDIHTPCEPPDNALSMAKEWITKGGKNLLWLPPYYRSIPVVGHCGTLVFGLNSGEVVFLRFNLEAC